MQPTFLFIGPDKTGSTWLHEMLRQHPQCYVPAIKDIYFFDRHYGRGMDWYLGFFREAPADARAVGELSHDYFFSQQAAERIAADLPGVRLLTFLRDPADRTFSQYLYMIRSGRTRVGFEEALEEYPELTGNSLYYKHLSVYLELFERDRLGLFLFDDLVADSRAFAADVFVFLGLDASVEIEYERKVLPASRPRSFLAARLAKLGANAARRLGLPGLVGTVKRSAATHWLYSPFEEADRPKMRPETRSRLLRIFRPDVERLEEALGRDLGSWLAVERTTAPSESRAKTRSVEAREKAG
ncbi:MAG: sulfotransferase domain-containing protein [Gemmatimonadota bacterium]